MIDGIDAANPRKKSNVFYCMLVSCHIHVPEWIYTLQLPECQGTPFSK